MIKKLKRQHSEREKMFTSHISDKELISKIYKELIQPGKKKHKTQFKNGQRTLIDIFPKNIHERSMTF